MAHMRCILRLRKLKLKLGLHRDLRGTRDAYFLGRMWCFSAKVLSTCRNDHSLRIRHEPKYLIPWKLWYYGKA